MYERRRLRRGAIYGPVRALDYLMYSRFVTVKTIDSPEIENIFPLIAIDS